jgi:hypothetical protein
MVLQQLAQARQSTSFQTSLSIVAAIESRPLGVLFFNLVRKALNVFLFLPALILNDLKLKPVAFATRIF